MKVNLDLLVKLVELKRQYSDEDWENIAEVLKNDSTRKQMIEVIEAIRKEKPATKSSKRQSTNKRTSHSPLSAIHNLEPEKAEKLTKLRRGIAEKHVFPLTKELREFAFFLGLKVAMKKNREGLTRDIIENLASSPVKEIDDKLLKFQAIHQDYSREYENWVKLILGEQERASEKERTPNSSTQKEDYSNLSKNES
jgi:hypothetical protein